MKGLTFSWILQKSAEASATAKQVQESEPEEEEKDVDQRQWAAISSAQQELRQLQKQVRVLLEAYRCILRSMTATVGNNDGLLSLSTPKPQVQLMQSELRQQVQRMQAEVHDQVFSIAHNHKR